MLAGCLIFLRLKTQTTDLQNGQRYHMSRLLILASKLGYQTRSFAEAARAMGVEVVYASDRCHQLEDPWSDGAIALQFDRPEEAARLIVQQSMVRPVDGLIA